MGKTLRSRALSALQCFKYVTVLLIFLCAGWSGSVWGQCTGNTISFGGGVAPAAGNTLTLATNQWATQYATVTSVSATTQYQSFSSISTDFITIVEVATGTVVGFGTQPVLWVSAGAGTYRIYCNTDAACGTSTTARNTSLYRTPTTPISYGSSTTTQFTGPVTKCVFGDKVIIGIQIVCNGYIGSLKVTGLTLRTDGTTNPTTNIASCRVYSTGNVNAFSTAALFGGAAVQPPGVDMNVTGNRSITNGVNYFWVVYNLNPTIPVGAVLDAQCTNVQLGFTSNYTPTVTNPAGNRPVIDCQPAPGGIENNLALWLKADAGITAAGVNVTGWADQGPLSNYTAISGSPDRVAVARNYNPAVLFTQSIAGQGGDFIQTNTMNIRSFFSVGQLLDLTRENTHILTYDQVSTGQPCGGCAIHGGGAASLLAEYGEWSYGSGMFQGTNAWRQNGVICANSNYTRHSGNFDIVGAVGAGTGVMNRVLGGQASTSTFNGRYRDWLGPVGEVILYPGVISAGEAIRIESYLAVKYGITLGGNGSTTAFYRNSAGFLTYPQIANYFNDVIGIARDDRTELLQKQSQTPDDTSRVYISTLATSNQLNTGTFAANESFIMMGRNLGKVCSTPASLLEKPAAIFSRLEREWRVVNTNFAETFNFDVKLNGCAVPGMVTASDLRLLVDANGDFSDATIYASGGGLSITYAAGVITVTGISTTHIPLGGSRYITIGSVDDTTPLPIELIAFNAECNGDNGVALKWATATELNNLEFTIERSLNGFDYESLAVVAGAGTSMAISHYTWIDQRPIPGVVYYRLKQSDHDGTFKHSDAVSVNCLADEDFVIFPNPATNEFSFQYSPSTGNEPLIIEMQTVSGELVLTRTYGATTEASRISVNIEGVREGIYFVRFTQGIKNKTFKLSVVR